MVIMSAMEALNSLALTASSGAVWMLMSLAIPKVTRVVEEDTLIKILMCVAGFPAVLLGAAVLGRKLRVLGRWVLTLVLAPIHILMLIFRGCQRVWRRLFRVYLPKGYKVGGVYPETVVADSPLFKATGPPCQVLIGAGGTVLGCGFRYEDALITAYHTFQAAEGPFWMAGMPLREGEPEKVALPLPDSVEVLPDLAVVRVRRWPTGVKSARFARQHEGYGRITGPLDQTSNGFIETGKMFGYVTYSGSTQGGFSGAPYMLGSHVAGIHLYGGVQNGGYSGPYLEKVLKPYLGKVPESSEDFVERLARRGDRLDYKKHPLREDRYLVYSGGEYYDVPSEQLRAVRRMEKQLGYQDVEDPEWLERKKTKKLRSDKHLMYAMEWAMAEPGELPAGIGGFEEFVELCETEDAARRELREMKWAKRAEKAREAMNKLFAEHEPRIDWTAECARPGDINFPEARRVRERERKKAQRKRRALRKLVGATGCTPVCGNQP
ncbi:hypothetical protein 1 [Xingshan nematode virus 5]|uniref:hypothetical protein 1 n=1 Tax=Xingshan nematode virus 5 TaxID=1923764 RepID=UPI0009099BF1|nr:hypothetical protein 1 [Xingshan nematode virus 5]APG75961.1 hypothetical protein 1 [Xingshan nematode virus 5]